MTALELHQIGANHLQEAGISNADFESSLLLCHLLQISRAQLFVHREDLPESLINSYNALLARRRSREPLAYILGEWEFWSLPFSVNSDVLIPRPETEVIVEHVLHVFDAGATGDHQPLSVLDMGAGSGILTVILARELPRARVVSLDIDRRAQKVARANAERHNVLDQVAFLNGDWLQAFRPGPLFDLIVSNPPYVALESFAGLQPEVRDFEPRVALDGGERGLREIRRFADDLAVLLKPGGYFFMEIGADQKEEIIRLFSRMGSFEELTVFDDYAGLPRVFQARKKTQEL